MSCRDLNILPLNCIVGLDRIGIRPVRALHDRCRRHGQRILANRHDHAGVHELARPKPLIVVIESRLQLHCAGRGIDLIVDQRQLALRKNSLVITGIGCDGQLTLRLIGFDLIERLLGDREGDEDRLHLSDRHQVGRGGSLYKISDIDLACACASSDW